MFLKKNLRRGTYDLILRRICVEMSIPLSSFQERKLEVCRTTNLCLLWSISYSCFLCYSYHLIRSEVFMASVCVFVFQKVLWDSLEKCHMFYKNSSGYFENPRLFSFSFICFCCCVASKGALKGTSDFALNE